MPEGPEDAYSFLFAGGSQGRISAPRRFMDPARSSPASRASNSSSVMLSAARMAPFCASTMLPARIVSRITLSTYSATARVRSGLASLLIEYSSPRIVTRTTFFFEVTAPPPHRAVAEESGRDQSSAAFWHALHPDEWRDRHSLSRGTEPAPARQRPSHR